MKIRGRKLTGMHADTTSISLYGDDYVGEQDDLSIAFGYSKAHRPDLKQFLYELVINQEDIPLYADLQDGNMNDKTWSKELLTKFKKIDCSIYN